MRAPAAALAVLSLLVLHAAPAVAGAMRIASLTPATARPGENVTLNGSFPGARPAGVRVRYGADGEALGETGLPVVWTPAQITVQLPRDLPPGSYWLAIYDGEAPVSDRLGLEVVARSVFPTPAADGATNPAERLRKLPEGIVIPDGQVEALRTLPYVMSFEAAVPDCPAEPFPKDFLSYRVVNDVRRVTIDAVYADGRTRRFHDEAVAEPRPELEATGLSDPGITRGQVAYLLEATGGEGGVARKELPFRVAAPVTVTLRSPFREVAGQAAGGDAGGAAGGGVGGPGGGEGGGAAGRRYEADAEIAYPAGIRRITLEGKSATGETVLTLKGEVAGGKIVSAPIPAAPAEGVEVAVTEFLLHVETDDPCAGPATINQQAAVAPH